MKTYVVGFKSGFRMIITVSDDGRRLMESIKETINKNPNSPVQCFIDNKSNFFLCLSEIEFIFPEEGIQNKDKI